MLTVEQNISWIRDQEDVNDKARPCRPSKSTTDENIEAVKRIILYKYRIPIRKVADDVEISFDLCQVIFKNILSKKRAAQKIVSKLLNFQQKYRCIDFVQEMLGTFNDELDLIKKFIIGNE